MQSPGPMSRPAAELAAGVQHGGAVGVDGSLGAPRCPRRVEESRGLCSSMSGGGSSPAAWRSAARRRGGRAATTPGPGRRARRCARHPDGRPRGPLQKRYQVAVDEQARSSASAMIHPSSAGESLRLSVCRIVRCTGCRSSTRGGGSCSRPASPPAHPGLPSWSRACISCWDRRAKSV